MKKSLKTLLTAVASVCALSVASASFAQYGACEPACDVPAVEACAPNIEAPSCGPVYDTTCAPSYEPGYGCDIGYGCGGGLHSFLDGVAQVAVAPFRWIACAFTEGVYPDCGCAPIPPRNPCNPCTVCGDYVGGCNDAYCANGYGGGQLSYATAPNPYPIQSYGAPVDYYDVESYDASPTRLSMNGRENSGVNFARSFQNPNGMQRPVAPRANVFANAQPNAAPNPVRPVNYEQMRNLSQSRDVRAMNRPLPQQVQNVENPRFVASAPEAPVAPSAKTFGTTRAIR